MTSTTAFSPCAAQVRAYSALRPEDRRALLTERGARERLRAKNITMRQSLASFGPGSAGAGAASGGGGGGSMLRRSRATALPPPAGGGGMRSGGGRGSDLRSSVHNVLQQHFKPAEMLRLSVPADMFKAMKAAAAAATAASTGNRAGSGGGGPVFASVATIAEEDFSRQSGGSGSVASAQTSVHGR